METKRTGKTLAIAGPEGPVKIEPGAYYANTKARAKRIMREPLSSEANRVHACLELATMAFRQELAVKMVQGRQVPLTPSDIAQQTGLSKQNTRRGLVELEQAGLAERRPADGTSSLQKGKVLIYSWAVPRKKTPPDTSDLVVARDYQNLPDISPLWSLLVSVSKRLRIPIDPEKLAKLGGDEIRAGEVVARDYQNAEMVVARFLKGVSARLPNEPAYRKKYRDIKTTATGTSAPLETPAAAEQPEPPPGETPSPDPPEATVPDVKPSTARGSFPFSSPPSRSQEARSLRDALRPIVPGEPVDLPTAARILERSRASFPGATLAEVLAMCRLKAQFIRPGKYKSAVGYLVAVVPQAFDGFVRTNGAAHLPCRYCRQPEGHRPGCYALGET